MEELLGIIMVTFWVSLPFIFGFIGSKITESKGRGGAVGFILGFFLNILGLIIAILLGESDDRKFKKKLQEAKLMKEALRDEE